MSSGIEKLNYATINGLQSLSLDELSSTNITASNFSGTNIDGDFFQINTIESNNVLVDNELHLTNNGFIIVGKDTESEVIITDDDIKLLDGLTSNVQSQINNISTGNSNLATDITTLEQKTQHITSDATNTIFSSNINLQTNKLLINGLFQNRAFTDTIYSQHNQTQTDTQYISSDGNNTTYLKNLNVNNICEFSNKSNLYIVEEDTYGKIGKLSATKDFYIQSDNTLNNDIILESFGGKTIVKKNLKLETTLEIKSETQNYAYTNDHRVGVLESIALLAPTINQVELNKTNNETNTDAIVIMVDEYESQDTRITALETGSTKIFEQNNIGWNSVSATNSVWTIPSKSHSGSYTYDMGNSNHTLFNSVTGRWQMGTRRMLINIEASYTVTGMSVKYLQSLIRVENSSNVLVHGSYSQGVSRTSFTTHLDVVNYNAMLVVTISDGDKVYIATSYDVITGSNSPSCNFNVLFNEM